LPTFGRVASEAPGILSGNATTAGRVGYWECDSGEGSKATGLRDLSVTRPSAVALPEGAPCNSPGELRPVIALKRGQSASGHMIASPRR